MSDVRSGLGDSHNFGRRVAIRGDRVVKPRTVFWEWLLLSAESPLRQRLAGRADLDLTFLPDLAFENPTSPHGGTVERLELAPLGDLPSEQRRALARIVGRALALFSWLGVADLHWENLALGRAPDGRIVFAPLDVEMILADLSLPTETKLLPDADPEYAALCRHAAGVRRVLPYVGKPIEGEDLVAMAAAYDATLRLLDRHAPAIAETLRSMPGTHEAPIRVCLRSTGEYVQPDQHRLWPPLLDEEREQLERGDIPYFFRLYGRPGIHYYANPSLDRAETLPLEGDVPQLDPLLSLSRDLRSPSRTSLREQGLFAVLAAFDHRPLTATYASDGMAVAFRERSIVVTHADGDELETPRDLSAFVGSVYLPCTCGEVRSVFVPPVTRCDGVRDPDRRVNSRPRGRTL